MNTQQRIENVMALGYARREAAFLTVAALHSGYFLTRQYLRIAAVSSGWAPATFISRGLDAGHFKTVPNTRGRSKLYSISSKPFFAAIGEEDNRNRRLHTPMEMRRRVMILDYVLAHPGEWLATETERNNWFGGIAGISTAEMPSRVYPGRNGQFTRRYFVDKTPVCVASKNARARFIFFDPGYHSEEPFTSFLALYRPLFAGLEQVEICYVSAHHWRFDKCARIVRSAFGEQERTSPDQASSDRLAAYFELESRYKESGWRTFDFPEMQRLKADREYFASADTSHLFDAWKRGGIAELDRILAVQTTTETGSRVEFSTHLLSENYDIFGRVPDVHGPTIHKTGIVGGIVCDSVATEETL